MLLRTVRATVMIAAVSGSVAEKQGRCGVGAASWFLLLDADQEEGPFHLPIFSREPILSLALASSPALLLLLRTSVTSPRVQRS